MKKQIALLAAAAMTISAVAPCCYAKTVTPPASVSAKSDKAASDKSSEADTKDKSDMENALATVKSRITIPEEYSKFSCTTGENNGLKNYYFTWENPDDPSVGGYYVSVTGSLITSYTSPDRYNYSSKKGFAKLSKKTFASKALNWLYAVNPSMKGYAAADDDIRLTLDSDVVRVNISRKYGSTEVRNNNGCVYLNKYTGDVLGMDINWWQDAKFSSPAVLSQEAIKEIYAKEVTIKPWYRISTDYETNKKIVNIVYEPQNSFIYDASTGSRSTMNDDYLAALDTDKYTDNGADFDDSSEAVEEEALDDEAAASPATGVKFTDEEKKKLADMSKMLTSDKFKELMIKDKYIGVTKSHLVSDFNINYDENADSGFSINCHFYINNKKEYSDIYVTADAESGKVISFSNYSLRSKQALDVKKANSIAEEAAKYYYGDIFSEYKADPENTAPAVKTENYTVTSRSFKFYRYVNNIQVSGDSITVNVNSDGKVTSVSAYHTKDVDFGDGKIVNKQKALELLFAQQDMSLYYDGFTDYKSVPHTYLIYSMDSWNLNARTGKLCDHNGKAIETTASQSSTCPYTDLDNSQYKSEIATLYNYGIKISDNEKFSPKAKMTSDEVTALLSLINAGYYDDPVVYENAAGGSGRSSSSAYLTRKELAKLFVSDMGADRYAKMKNIYKSPFKDVSDSSEYVGYISIAWAVGAIDGSKNGSFDPDGYVTREYAYHCIYNYILNCLGS